MTEGVTPPLTTHVPSSFTTGGGVLLLSSDVPANTSNVASLCSTPQEEEGTSGGSPWVPAVLVGCSMLLFLALSFLSHHRRVRRKRQILMDYLSMLLASGTEASAYSDSIVCNTNFLDLSQLGKSFKKSGKKGAVGDVPLDESSPDFLRECYMMDLVELSSVCQSNSVLKRFIPMTSEHKFWKIAKHLISLNFAARPGGGSLCTFNSNQSVPEDFDPSCVVDFPSSLSEVRTSITQEVLLDPQRLRREEVAEGTNAFTSSDTIPEALSDHSYQTVVFNDQAGSCQVSPVHPACSDASLAQYGFSASPERDPKRHMSESAHLRSMWLLNKLTVSPPCVRCYCEPCRERWDFSSGPSAFPAVCMNGSSVLSPHMPFLGMPCCSPNTTAGTGVALHINSPFSADCKGPYFRHHEQRLGQHPALTAVSSLERSCYNLPHAGGSAHESRRCVCSGRSSSRGETVAECDTACMQRKGASVGLDGSKHQDKPTEAQNDSFQRGDFEHLQSTDRQHNVHLCHFINRQTHGCCESLDDGSQEISELPTSHKTPTRDYKSMFPAEHIPSLTPHHPQAFLPTAFSCQEGPQEEEPRSLLSSPRLALRAGQAALSALQ